MKLNPDCLRAVLLFLEDSLCFFEEDGSAKFRPIYFFELANSEKLISYSKDELFYSIHNLKQAGYINASIRYDLDIYDHCSVLDITFSGHQFLEKIRDDERFSKTKAIASSLRDFSLSAICSIAEGISSAAISAYFSQPSR